MTLAQFKREVRKQQLYYPFLKFKKIRQDWIEDYYKRGWTPIDMLNDILTVS